MSDTGTQHAVQSIVNAINTSIDSDDDFVNVVSATRRSFRPNELLHRSSRGRRQNNLWKKRTFLVRKANTDFYPSRNEVSYLNEIGFGYSKETNPIFNMAWSFVEIENYVCSLYSDIPLNLIGFRIGRTGSDRKINLAGPVINNILDLKNFVGQSCLIIVPNRDVPISNAPNARNDSGSSARSSTYHDVRYRSRRSQISNTVDGESITSRRVSSLISESEHNHQYVTNSSPARNVVTGGSRPRRYNITTPPIPVDTVSNHSNDEDDLDITENFDFSNESEDSNFAVDCPQLIDETIEITVDRDNILESVLQYYKNDDIVNHKLKVIFKNEAGEDFGGLCKEMFTLFWKQVTDNFFIGENAMVPHLPWHRYRKEKDTFILIGRVMSHCYYLTQTLPIKISKTFLLQICKPNCILTDEIILSDLYMFVTLYEKTILNKAMHDYSSLTESSLETLESFFSANGLYENPCKNEITEQIMTIAKIILIKQPADCINDIRSGIPLTHFDSFWNILNTNNIISILRKQRATPEKVVNCIITSSDLKNEEDRVLYFFKNYIYSLNTDELDRLLIFITGSCVLPNAIYVQYTTLTGLNVRPISHTCSNTIELSVSFDSFHDFKKNMNDYLKSELSFHYTQI